MIAAHAFVRPGEVWSSWAVHPEAIAPLVVAALWYAYGAGSMPAWSRRRSASFLGGLVIAAIALASPLDALGETIFAGHMVQHLVLMLVAAPLLAYGAPSVPMTRALPDRVRHALGRIQRRNIGRTLGRAARRPFVALAAHALLLWLWHLPALYEAALGGEAMHALEHLSFLGTAFWFWATIIPVRRRSGAPYPVRILAVFGNLLQSGALGVLLLFASRPLYTAQISGAEAWGLSPLQDQQLAGVLMWIPPAALYFGVMAVLFVRWLRSTEARLRSREVSVRMRHEGAGRA
jgi:putative membrane protein